MNNLLTEENLKDITNIIEKIEDNDDIENKLVEDLLDIVKNMKSNYTNDLMDWCCIIQKDIKRINEINEVIKKERDTKENGLKPVYRKLHEKHLLLLEKKLITLKKIVKNSCLEIYAKFKNEKQLLDIQKNLKTLRKDFDLQNGYLHIFEKQVKLLKKKQISTNNNNQQNTQIIAQEYNNQKKINNNNNNKNYASDNIDNNKNDNIFTSNKSINNSSNNNMEVIITQQEDNNKEINKDNNMIFDAIKTIYDNNSTNAKEKLNKEQVNNSLSLLISIMFPDENHPFNEKENCHINGNDIYIGVNINNNIGTKNNKFNINNKKIGKDFTGIHIKSNGNIKYYVDGSSKEWDMFGKGISRFLELLNDILEKSKNENKTLDDILNSGNISIFDKGRAKYLRKTLGDVRNKKNQVNCRC